MEEQKQEGAVMPDGDAATGGDAVPRRTADEQQKSDVPADSAGQHPADGGGSRVGHDVVVPAVFYIDAESTSDELTDVACRVLIANGDGKKTMVMASNESVRRAYLAVEARVFDMALAGLRARGLL